MQEVSFTAWAIDTCYVDIDGTKCYSWIGRYWFGEQIPEYLEGCHIALFKTRAIARCKLADVRKSYPDAKVVKVQVQISEEKKCSG